MNVATLIDALALPPDTRVDQRVAKKLLLEQGAPTAADKRQISAGIEELLWIAALKPTRLIQLIHRAIPYPVVLVTQHGDTVNLSLAHKRWSQGQTGKTVLDGDVVAVEWNHERHEKRETHESESSFRVFRVFRGSKRIDRCRN